MLVSSGHIVPVQRGDAIDDWRKAWHSNAGAAVASILNLDEAAAFLKTTPEAVSSCIRDAGLPAAKVGQGWVLVDDDVLAWVRSRYPREAEAPVAPKRALKVPLGVGGAPRDSIGTGEIAEMLGLSRSYVTNKVVTRPDFPEPVFNISNKSRRWSTDQVSAYFQPKPRRQK